MAFPTTPILDTFGGGDEAGPVITGWGAAFSPGLQITGGQLAQFDTSDNGGYYLTDPGANDVEYGIEITTLPATGGETMVCARYNPATGGFDGSGYGVKHTVASGTDTIKIIRIDAGVETTIAGPWGHNLSNGDAIGIRVSGHTITAYKRVAGVWSQVADATDYRYSGAAPNRQGALYLLGNGSSVGRWDNFFGGAFVTAAGDPPWPPVRTVLVRPRRHWRKRLRSAVGRPKFDNPATSIPAVAPGPRQVDLNKTIVAVPASRLDFARRDILSFLRRPVTLVARPQPPRVRTVIAPRTRLDRVRRTIRSKLGGPFVLRPRSIGRFKATLSTRNRVERGRRAPHSKLRPPTVVGVAPTPPLDCCEPFDLLLEDGGLIFLETGTDYLILEGGGFGPVIVGSNLNPRCVVTVDAGCDLTGVGIQWQEGASPNGPWIDIPGATDETYVIRPGGVGLFLRAALDNTCFSGVVGPVFSRTFTNLLGAGEYEALILARGGTSVVGVLPWNNLSWSRVLDETSEASVSGSTGLTADCCALVSRVKPWRHELAVFRDGEMIWVGPVMQVRADGGDQYTISARDLTAWWDRRLIHETHAWDMIDLAEAFQQLVDDAMAPDPSPNLTLATTTSGVTGKYRVAALQHQMAGVALRELTDIGIDWTVIGREVRAGGIVVPAQPLGTFTDEHCAAPPSPVLSGEMQTNAPTVRGEGGGVAGDRVYATAIDGLAILEDGLLESVETVQTISDHNSATAAAESRLELRSAITQIDSVQLIPEAPFPVSLLIPGALCRLALSQTCIPVYDNFRLKSVESSVDFGSPDVITLNFQPVGTTRTEEKTSA